MNEREDSIRFHRQEMAYWLELQKDAKYRGDVDAVVFTTEQYRYHRDALQALWASPAEQLAVCV